MVAELVEAWLLSLSKQACSALANRSTVSPVVETALKRVERSDTLLQGQFDLMMLVGTNPVGDVLMC